jgi:hypothetical protein
MFAGPDGPFDNVEGPGRVPRLVLRRHERGRGAQERSCREGEGEEKCANPTVA